MRGRWDETPSLDARVLKLVRLLQDDQLPDGVAYELETLAHQLEAPHRHSDALRARGSLSEDELSEMLTAEAQRILQRKQVRSAQGRIPPQEIEELLKRLRSKEADPLSLAQELILARSLLPAFQLAHRRPS